MNNPEYFKISSVAKLTNVTRQTLIFYDKKDILRPAFIDENKYRYYSITQIHQIQIINILKEFGLPLKTIKAYLDKKDKDQLMMLLTDVENKMYEQIKRTNNYIKIINHKKDLLGKSSDIKDYNEIKLENRKALKVYTSRRLTDQDQNGDGHFRCVHDFENDLNDKGLLGLEHSVIVENKYLNEDFDNHISYLCVPLTHIESDLEYKIVEKGLYVVGYHKGKFQKSVDSYKRLFKYIEDNNLEIAGNSFETIISNFLTEESEEDYLIEIAILIKKK
ncbi:MerR family transcriptional regulator [Acidaminobacter sp. JC074]|uniref:MerR family transcriptional regulator n=1 Tax=Acidaminobacter sp. JC074 TaxID=2530199 RepID=UPI001F0F6477|nr:MerR family transcriptional regulator [Acidaminobacter sp. JC074]MCH4890073.1 MerR family transcriptional regulator [Acidaminobacter sp. JC074]